jgi:enamine deaminase RidA (YjgF/YER057c/UK114 family)
MLSSCNSPVSTKDKAPANSTAGNAPEYFNLRPELEKDYDYTHAVRIGDDLKISGAVSMDSAGIIIGQGDMTLQMKNCYSDLEKILKHYGYTFDDVYAENVYTTDMDAFIKASVYRNTIYTKQFPTGTWLQVKGLALHGQLIEIDIEGTSLIDEVVHSAYAELYNPCAHFGVSYKDGLED